MGRLLETPASGFSQIYLRSLDGQTRAPLRPTSWPRRQMQPDWSPRGDWVAYQEWRAGWMHPDIHVYNRDTQEERLLTGGLEGADESPAFSPNGRQIAYLVHLMGASGEADSAWQLRRIDLDGTQDVALVESPAAVPLRSPRWSPDGAVIYYAAGDRLFAVSASGAPQGSVVDRSAVLHHAPAFDLHRGVGPIAFEHADSVEYGLRCYEQGPYGYVEFNGRIKGMPFRHVALRDTFQRLPLAQFDRRFVSRYAPRWSYDGTRIAYASDENEPGTARDVFVGQVSWNRPPAFTAAPQDTVIELGAGFTLNLAATDPDGETVTYAAACLPAGAALEPSTGAISWPNPTAPDTHDVVLRALDGSGGVAQRVVRWVTVPAVRPAVTADLAPEFVSTTTITVSWTAVGDDSLAGTATAYDVRRSGAALGEASWAAATPASGEPAPDPAGSYQSFTLTGLTPCTWYYIGLKTADEAGNTSALGVMTPLKVKTLCGGGYAAARGDGRSEAGSFAALPRAADRVVAVERAGPAAAPRWTVRALSEEEGRAALARGGAGIAVERRDGTGAWRPSGQLAPPPSAAFGLSARDDAERRLVFLDGVGLRQVAERTAAGEGAGGAEAALAGATHSTLGDLSAALLAGEGLADLAPGEALEVRYAASEESTGTAAGWGLLLERLTAATASRAGRREAAAAPPVAYALHPGQPNPFTGRTAIRFDLPRAGTVRLAVYDLQGRVVAVLADGPYPAGRHALDWGRTARGAAVPAGVYFARLEAGAFRAQRKLVALP